MVNDFFIGDGSNLVTCKCGVTMELVEGKVDYNQKDEQGKKMNRDAAAHMAKYRVRCVA